jgi:hypothetical protein
MAKSRALIVGAICAVVVGLGVLATSPFGGGIWPWLIGQDRSALSEAKMATNDHDMITRAIADLCGNKLYTLVASSGTPLGLGSSTSNAHATFFQEAATNYSAEIRDRRIKLDEQIGKNEAVQWWFRAGIVLFGCLATIMIGVKPLFEQQSSNYVIACGAIIFSAVVTALSSMSALTTSQNDLVHNQRTLAQLQQLHWRIGNDVFAATELCKEESKDLQKVESWKDRFEQIANDAMPVISQPEDLRNGQDPSQALLERLQHGGSVVPAKLDQGSSHAGHAT